VAGKLDLKKFPAKLENEHRPLTGNKLCAVLLVRRQGDAKNVFDGLLNELDPNHECFLDEDYQFRQRPPRGGRFMECRFS
jgi:hypothetical protein